MLGCCVRMRGFEGGDRWLLCCDGGHRSDAGRVWDVRTMTVAMVKWDEEVWVMGE